MPAFKNIKPATNQKGAALLLFFIVLILAGLTFILSILPTDLKLKQQNQTSQALSQAKRALISYAVSNYYRTNFNTNEILSGWHGYLPCPETSSGSEGSQDANCNSFRINALGRLPWKTLNIDPLKDATGQCLWYAVSAAYKFGPKQLHNADSLGMFDIYDTEGNKLNSDQPEDRIVAIVFAPGKQLSGQNRSTQNTLLPCGNPQNLVQAENYLDSINTINNASISADTDQIDRFAGLFSNIDLNNFNDRIITITRGEIFNTIKAATKASQVSPTQTVNSLQEQLQNLGSRLAQCLVSYARASNSRFPWPGRVDMNSSGTSDDYRNNTNYTDWSDNTDGYLGRLPMDVSHSNLYTGQTRQFLFDYCRAPPLNTAQHRLWNDWKDYFFLVIGRDFSPASLTTTPLCNASSCPTLSTTNYAALIIISNIAINNNTFNQRRRDLDIETLPQNSRDLKGNISNYLEGVNATNFGARSLGTYSNTTGNDIFIAIDTNMNITCFNLNSQAIDRSCPNI